MYRDELSVDELIWAAEACAYASLFREARDRMSAIAHKLLAEAQRREREQLSTRDRA